MDNKKLKKKAFTISRLTSVRPGPREYRSRVTWWKWKCASVKQSALLYTTATWLAALGMPLPWLAVTWDCLGGRAFPRDCPDADACLTPGFPSRTPSARNSALSFPGRQAPKAKRTHQYRRHAMEFKDSMLKASGKGSPNRSRNRTHKRFDEQFRGMDMAPDLCNRRALRSNPSKVGFQRLRWRARNNNRSSMRSMYSWTCSSDQPPWASWRCRSSWAADTNGTRHCKQVMSPRTYQGRWLDRAWSAIFERFLPWRSNLQLGYGHLPKSTVPSAFWWRTHLVAALTLPPRHKGQHQGPLPEILTQAAEAHPRTRAQRTDPWAPQRAPATGSPHLEPSPNAETSHQEKSLGRAGPPAQSPAKEEMDSALLQWACPPATQANLSPVAKEIMAGQRKPQEEAPLRHHPPPRPPPPQDSVSGPPLNPPWE